MITSAAPAAAQASAISGSRRPLTSLIMAAPAASAAWATGAFQVSTETIRPSAASRSTRGTTRSISTSGGSGSALVTPDSPPTSIISAPCSVSSSARRSWAARSATSEPSENDSGDAFTIPIKSGRLESSSSTRPGMRRVNAVI